MLKTNGLMVWWGECSESRSRSCIHCGKSKGDGDGADEKGPPAGTFDKPVAGFLYFPLTVLDPNRARLTLDFLSDETVAGAAAARLSLYD